VITGFAPREAVAVAELQDGVLALVGQVTFGLGKKGVVAAARPVARRPETRSRLIPVRPKLVAEVRFVGRDRTGCARDGVLLAFG